MTVLVTAQVCAPPLGLARQSVELPRGVLTKVYVLIPPGHHALARLRVLRGGTQIIPHHGWIQGDFETLEWSEMITIPSEEKFTLEAVNDDSVYEHCFYVRFEIQPQHIAHPYHLLTQLLKRFMEVLGVE